MNNPNMMPMWPNPNGNMNYQMFPNGNSNSYNNSNYLWERLNNLENQINRLERQVRRMDARINKLEGMLTSSAMPKSYDSQTTGYGNSNDKYMI